MTIYDDKETKQTMKITNWLEHVAGWLVKPLKEHGAFFLSMYVLGIICGYVELHDWDTVYENLWFELFFDLYIICVLLTLLPHRVAKWVRRVLYVLFYGLALIDVYCFVKFQSVLNPTILLLVAETTTKEAGEFLVSYVTPDILLSELGWVVALIIVHGLLNLLKKKRNKLKIHIERLKDILPRCRRIAWNVVAIAVIVLLVWSAIRCLPNKQAMQRMFSYQDIGRVEHELTRKDCTRFYAPPYRMAFSIFANRLTDQQLETLLATKDKAAVDSCSFTSPHIVLIIGESYNKHHAQLYGYDKPTTPRQLERQRKGELVAYSDVVSPWNLTSYVFKLMFSLYTAGDKGEWCDYPLFTELFRKAGYRVTFITNQFLPKAKDAVYNFSGGFFLNNPELSEAQFDARNDKLHVFDEDLIRDYEQLTGNGATCKAHPSLTIFHLYGQHVDYRIRCPKSRMTFQPSDYDRPKMPSKNRRLLAYYDNSILYNDSVVNAIIGKVEDDDAIVIYVPDHGEEVFGPGAEHFFGRMHSVEITPRLAREEFEIPMWIWCSHRYMVNHPEIAHAVVTSRNRRFMTDALPHMLLYLGGIHTKDYRPELNLLGDEYNEQRPRMLKATTNYDEIMTEKK